MISFKPGDYVYYIDVHGNSIPGVVVSIHHASGRATVRLNHYRFKELYIYRVVSCKKLIMQG